MTKYIKNGQLITIGTCVYKARRRINGCHGCDLNDITLCPCIADSRSERRYDCSMYDVLLKRLT